MFWTLKVMSAEVRAGEGFKLKVALSLFFLLLIVFLFLLGATDVFSPNKNEVPNQEENQRATEPQRNISVIDSNRKTEREKEAKRKGESFKFSRPPIQ